MINLTKVIQAKIKHGSLELTLPISNWFTSNGISMSDSQVFRFPVDDPEKELKSIMDALDRYYKTR
jgi:hypothetical protein